MPCAISVLTERREAATSLLTAARQLADLVGPSEMTVLAVRRSVSIPMIAMTEGRSTQETVSQYVAMEEERLAALGDAYQRWAAAGAGESLSSRRIIAEGDAAAAIKESAASAAFLVVARPMADDDEETQETFRTALLDTDRPVLVVPSAPLKTFGDRVAIAWRDDKHARQALVSALPLLKNAAEIHVFAGRREGQPTPMIPDALLASQPAPKLHELMIGGPPLGEVILSQSRVLDIDLLVMGAYFHSPLRERIFGGVTRHMLANADLPLLMFH